MRKIVIKKVYRIDNEMQNFFDFEFWFIYVKGLLKMYRFVLEILLIVFRLIEELILNCYR